MTKGDGVKGRVPIRPMRSGLLRLMYETLVKVSQSRFSGKPINLTVPVWDRLIKLRRNIYQNYEWAKYEEDLKEKGASNVEFD